MEPNPPDPRDRRDPRDRPDLADRRDPCDQRDSADRRDPRDPPLPYRPAASPHPLALLRHATAARRAAGLGRRLDARRPGAGGPVDLASNDYLGLSGDKRLADAAVTAARKWGTGATGSRLVTGTTQLHERLEHDLARFTGAETALVFSSGYLANLAVIATLGAVLAAAHRPPAPPSPAILTGAHRRPVRLSQPDPGPPSPALLVVSDAANHASLIDACRLSRARVEVTPHADVGAVERALAARTEPSALVVSDTVFSVSGDLAPVAGLHRAARAHQALLVLDEAHALGVLGPGGRGVAAAAGIAAEPDVIRTLTLSKSLAGQGGAVAGPAEVIETLIDAGRAFIFDTGLAPPSAGAAVAALEILDGDPGLALRAQANARRLADMAADLGFDVSSPAAAVVRLMFGEPAAALDAQRLCADHGVRVGCFRPPSVPPGQACLRLTARANLTELDFAAAFRALGAVRDHVRITA
jgi:8-amino-7-oxononanoate synthase